MTQENWAKSRLGRAARLSRLGPRAKVDQDCVDGQSLRVTQDSNKPPAAGRPQTPMGVAVATNDDSGAFGRTSHNGVTLYEFPPPAWSERHNGQREGFNEEELRRPAALAYSAGQQLRFYCWSAVVTDQQ